MGKHRVGIFSNFVVTFPGMQYGTAAHSTVLICQQLVYKFVHVYFWIISVLSRSMVVTERQVEAMLNCHMELERIHVRNGQIIIGRSENVKARTVGGLSRSIVTEEEVEAMTEDSCSTHRSNHNLQMYICLSQNCFWSSLKAENEG